MKLLAQLGFVTLILLIFIGGGQPGAGQLFIPPWDKVAHLITYAIILILARIGFPKVKLFYLFMIVILIGALDEAHQIYLPGRVAAFDDLLADIIGALIAFYAIKLFNAKLAKHH